MLQYYVNLPSPEGMADMQKQQNLQDFFLNQARRDRTPVTVFLMNGFQCGGSTPSWWSSIQRAGSR